MTIANLTTEIARASAFGPYKGTFTKRDGSTVQGITESDLKSHLTSTRFGMYADGRQFRFPGIGGWGFETKLEEAGYKIITAKNRRGQECNVVVKA